MVTNIPLMTVKSSMMNASKSACSRHWLNFTGDCYLCRPRMKARRQNEVDGRGVELPSLERQKVRD